MLFVVLLGVSVVSLLLPSRYTGPLIGLVQVLTPFQDVANRAVDSVAGLGADSGDDLVSEEAYAGLAIEAESYRNTVAALSLRLQELEHTNRELLGIRARSLGPDGQLIPARVISGDVLSWRRSKLVDAGTLRGVREGAAVTSHHFTAAAGSQAGVRSGMHVLAGETLVGTVVQAATHTSRIRLLSDPETRMPVTIGRPESDGLAPLQSEFWLVGAARAGLQVRDVDHRYIENGAIEVGDVVLTSRGDPALPLPVVIGTVKEIRRDQGNGLLHILDVEPAVSPDELRKVYIVDMGGTNPAG